MPHPHEKGNMFSIESVSFHIKIQCTKSPRLPGMTERAPWRVLETCSICLITDLKAIPGCYKGYQIHPKLRISLTFLSSLLHPWMLQAHLWHCWVYTCWIIHSSGAITILISRWWQRERGEGEKSSSLKWGYQNSYHLGMPAGMSWSIIGQHAPSK